MSQPAQYYTQGGHGQLVVNLRKPFGLLSSSMMTPKVLIDGFPAPARWEQNAYPVAAGRHQVRASTNYLWEFGAAETPVDIGLGQSVEVHYSSPLITFIGGKIGFSQQPRPGIVAFWIILAIPIAIVVLIIAGVVASSLS
jgi:hypothetical protein